MLVLLEVCDLIVLAMKERRPDKLKEIAHKLAFAAKTYLDAYVAARARIKHHELQHLASQLLLDLAQVRLHACAQPPCNSPERCQPLHIGGVNRVSHHIWLHAAFFCMHAFPSQGCLLTMLDRGAQEQ
jgi:hypothetical protein